MLNVHDASSNKIHTWLISFFFSHLQRCLNSCIWKDFHKFCFLSIFLYSMLNALVNLFVYLIKTKFDSCTKPQWNPSNKNVNYSMFPSYLIPAKHLKRFFRHSYMSTYHKNAFNTFFLESWPHKYQSYKCKGAVSLLLEVMLGLT